MQPPDQTAAAPFRPAGSCRCDLLSIALLGLVLFAPFLGRRALWTSGEARVAQVARQMRFSAGTREWIVPYLGEDERLKKPPLAYWLAALASLPWADVDEANSRIPNVAAAIGAMLLVCLLGCRLAGRLAGLLSGMMLGTTAVFWWQARTTGIEMPLLFFTVLALYSWWRYHEPGAGDGPQPAAGQPTPGWLLVCYAAMGFSFLQKGPVGPLLVLAIVLAYSALTGFRRPRPFHHAAGLLLLLAIALPWPILVLREMPEAWEIWFRESAGRYRGFDHIKDMDYFARKILGDGQPWVLVALLFPFLLRGQGRGERLKLLFPLAWAAVTLVFFSMPSSKKSYYILPIYPALALMSGIVFSAAVAGAAGIAHRILGRFLAFAGWLALSAGILASALLAAQASGAFEVFAAIFAHTQIDPAYADHWPQLVVGILAILVLGGGLVHAARRRRPVFAIAAMMLAAAVFFALHTSLLDDLNRHKGDRPLGHFLRGRLQPDDRTYTHGTSGLPTIMYYLSRGPRLQHVIRIDQPAKVLAALEDPAPGRVYLLTKKPDLLRLHSTYVLRPSGAASLHGGAAGPARSPSWAEAVARIQQDGRLLLLAKGRLPRRAQAGGDARPGAEYMLVCAQAPDARGEPQRLCDPLRARDTVNSAVAGLPMFVESLGERLARLAHPDYPSGDFWLGSVDN